MRIHNGMQEQSRGSFARVMLVDRGGLRMTIRVFVSYSHADEALRDQLEVQLAMLRRQGLIQVWHDRRLVAGDRLDWTISEELDQADIILLLVSPDFLASDYCYKIEKGRALERHRSGEARLISIILRPCDWQHSDLAEFLVTPKDGKPITQWPDRDEAFLDVVQSIRAALGTLSKAPEPKQDHDWVERAEPTEEVSVELPRSSNLRLRKTFSQADKDSFLLSTFEFIGRFFQGSLDELSKRNPGIEGRHRQIDANTFTTSIYSNGNKLAACTIRLSGQTGNSITYSQGDDANSNAFNEQLTVGSDDHSLFLRALGMPMMAGLDRDAKLSFEGAAEYYWALVIRPLQGE
jgi:hypothetical protein